MRSGRSRSVCLLTDQCCRLGVQIGLGTKDALLPIECAAVGARGVLIPEGGTALAPRFAPVHVVRHEANHGVENRPGGHTTIGGAIIGLGVGKGVRGSLQVHRCESAHAFAKKFFPLPTSKDKNEGLGTVQDFAVLKYSWRVAVIELEQRAVDVVSGIRIEWNGGRSNSLDGIIAGVARGG